jgi:hypothetical protein
MKEVLLIMVFLASVFGLMTVISGIDESNTFQSVPHVIGDSQIIVGGTDLKGRTIISIDHVINAIGQPETQYWCKADPLIDPQVGFFPPTQTLCDIPQTIGSSQQTTGTILTIALAITGLFLGLGILAGLGGAGQLANILSATGIGVAFITTINFVITRDLGQGQMPTLIWFVMNMVLIILYVYLIIRLLK